MNKLRSMLAAVVVLFVATTAIALAGQRSPAHTHGQTNRSDSGQVAHTPLNARQSTEQHVLDTDNVQQGDQISPDTASSGVSEEVGAPEAPSADTEQGQSGEPSGGHQDPPGDVNHECSGNCQE